MNDSILPIVTASSIVELLNSPMPKNYSSVVMDSPPSTSNNCGTTTVISATARNCTTPGSGGTCPSKMDENSSKLFPNAVMISKFDQQQKILCDQTDGSVNKFPAAIAQQQPGTPQQTNLVVEPPNICAGCKGKIVDRYLLKALDKLWHEDCLKCDACCCRLAEVGKSFFVKCGKIYCRKDYARLFLTKGRCSVCNNVIPAYELVMRASANVYHLECFSCQECNQRFCVGDRFYFDVDNNKILCEYDYNERMYFAQLAQTNFGYNSLAQLKRQISQVDDYDEVSVLS